MNCTAWNSVCANALTNSPRAIPRSALATASTPTSHAPCGESRPRNANPTTQTTAACTAASSPKAIAVAGEEVELRERQRHQPLERARRALAQHRDRRDEEHDDEREEAAERGADLLEGLLLAVEDEAHQHQQQARHDDQQRDRARVVADLPQHALGGGERRRARSSAVSAASITLRNAWPRSCSPVRARRSSRASPAREAPVAHQQEAVALARPRPSRGSTRAGSRRRRRARGTSSTARRGAPGRGRRSARRARAGRAVQQRARERDARALAARQRVGHLLLASVRGRRHRAPRRSDRRRRRRCARSSAGSPRP